MSLKVILSDFHFGARSSLFTNLTYSAPGAPFRVEPDLQSCPNLTHSFATALQQTLRQLDMAGPADLVLNGDVLDLSLGTPVGSSTIMQVFCKALLGTPAGTGAAPSLFGNVYFLPGNHDHSLWSAQRMTRAASPDAGPTNPEFWTHTTPVFAGPSSAPSIQVMDEVLQKSGFAGQLWTFNPNLGFLSADKKRAVVIHHGHYAEEIYTLMTRILEALAGPNAQNWSVDNLETANGAWIDFGWSTLGDLGELGSDMAVFMKLLSTGGAAHQVQLRIADRVAAFMQENMSLPRTSQMAEMVGFFSKAMVDGLVGKFSTLERFGYTQVLSEATIAGLKKYIGVTVRRQLRDELGGTLPEELTFVFGHTHKPFEDQIVVEGFDQPVSIYNTGGWVLDTPLFSTVQGASVAFVDDALNAAALRLFEMPVNRQVAIGPDGRRSPDWNDIGEVRVTTSDPRPDNVLVQKLTEAVAQTGTAWKQFSYDVQDQLLQKQDMYFKLADLTEADAQKTGGLI